MVAVVGPYGYVRSGGLRCVGERRAEQSKGSVREDTQTGDGDPKGKEP